MMLSEKGFYLEKNTNGLKVREKNEDKYTERRKLDDSTGFHPTRKQKSQAGCTACAVAVAPG